MTFGGDASTSSFIALAHLQYRPSGEESSLRAFSSLRTSSGKPDLHTLHMPQVKPSGWRNSTSARNRFASAAKGQRQRGPTAIKLGVLGFQADQMLHHQRHQYWWCGGRELTLEGNRHLRSGRASHDTPYASDLQHLHNTSASFAPAAEHLKASLRAYQRYCGLLVEELVGSDLRSGSRTSTQQHLHPASQLNKNANAEASNSNTPC